MMKNILKSADWAGLVLLLVFCYSLSSMIDTKDNIVGYGALVIIFVVESIRSYYKGLIEGVEMIQRIRNEK
jgi:hypothetical protein